MRKMLLVGLLAALFLVSGCLEPIEKKTVDEEESYDGKQYEFEAIVYDCKAWLLPEKTEFFEKQCKEFCEYKGYPDSGFRKDWVYLDYDSPKQGLSNYLLNGRFYSPKWWCGGIFIDLEEINVEWQLKDKIRMTFPDKCVCVEEPENLVVDGLVISKRPGSITYNFLDIWEWNAERNGVEK